MADVAAKLSWRGTGQQFDAGSTGGPAIIVDGDGAAGPSPVTSLLLAVGGCMGADVLDIAAKMRLPLSGLEVAVEADRRPEPPRYLTALRMRFVVSGLSAADEAKVRRAIDLSRETYCSVLHSLRPDTEVVIEVELR
jgi:putative redox protein